MPGLETLSMKSSLQEDAAPVQVVVSRPANQGTVRLMAGGELDCSSAHVLERSIRHEEGSGATEVIVDLEKTTFIDASGLKVLVRAAARAGQGGWKLRVENARGLVRRVFDITEMDAVIQHWQTAGVAGAILPAT